MVSKPNLSVTCLLCLWETNSKPQWRELLEDVLIFLIRQLLVTDLKDITKCTLSGAIDIVKSFNKDKLEQWKAKVRNGLGKKDWSDLIAHRLYHLLLISF